MNTLLSRPMHLTTSVTSTWVSWAIQFKLFWVAVVCPAILHWWCALATRSNACPVTRQSGVQPPLLPATFCHCGQDPCSSSVFCSQAHITSCSKNSTATFCHQRPCVTPMKCQEVSRASISTDNRCSLALCLEIILQRPFYNHSPCKSSPVVHVTNVKSGHNTPTL